jgi:hypothetical protein
MTQSPNTGPTVPAWIRDEIARQEERWPRLALAAGMLAAIGADVAMGALIWTADAVVYYARP